MCWCAESQMKWVWGEYCVLNNLKRGEFAEDGGQGNIPHCDSVQESFSDQNDSASSAVADL